MFYGNFVKLCALKKKSPSGVAKEIGLSNAAANGWKNGKMPNDTTLAKLASYFDVTVSDLLGEEKAPTKKSEEQKEKPPVNGELSEREAYLISLFRLVPEDRQESLLQTIEFALRSQGLL